MFAADLTLHIWTAESTYLYALHGNVSFLKQMGLSLRNYAVNDHFAAVVKMLMM